MGKGRIKILLPVVRAQLGRLSGAEVARRADISASTISDMERGDSKSIAFDTLAKLCEALKCQPGDLLRYVPQEASLPEYDPNHQLPYIGDADDPETVALIKRRHAEALEDLKAGRTIPASRLPRV
jgi:putative transcriptional regulator